MGQSINGTQGYSLIIIIRICLKEKTINLWQVTGDFSTHFLGKGQVMGKLRHT